MNQPKILKKRKENDPRKIRDLKDPRLIRGFTMIELIVALTVFLLVIIMVMNVFLTALAGSKRISNKQNIQDSGRFMLEAVAKEIRMSTLEGLVCDLGVGVTHTLDSLPLINSKGEAVTFRFSGTDFLRGDQALNPEEVKVTFGKFYVQKKCTLQPRITIVMRLEPPGRTAAEQVIVNLQNTISSRQYLLESGK